MIVLTEETRDFCLKQDLPVKMLDNYPECYLKFDKNRIEKTLHYLEQQKGAIIFFECFNIIEDIHTLKKFFLNHGSGLKFWLHRWRIRLINQCDYVSAIGPYNKKKLINLGVKEEKLIDIGPLRLATILNKGNYSQSRERVFDLAQKKVPIISYIPTWFGATSVRYTGMEIVRNISSDYILLFKPHPQTPPEILKDYERLIAHKKNVIFIEEGSTVVDLLALYKISDLFIGDVSSTIVDSILLDKPIIFAMDCDMRKHELTVNPYIMAKRIVKLLFKVGDKPFDQWRILFEPIREILEHCEKVDTYSAKDINSVIERSLAKGINKKAWTMGKKNMFYNLDSDPVEELSRKIIEIMGKAPLGSAQT